ncbi:MAG: ATP-binding protein [Enhygromyxa sp.]
MSEAALQTHARPPAGVEAGRGTLPLRARVRALAERLSQLLAPLDSPELPHGGAFLRSMASADASGPGGARIDQASAEVLERLARVWQLDALDLDLLALAAMPDEHEGYASILQSLHPRSEARASVGLAAQLLAASAEERELLRQRLDEGPLTRVGLLALPDDGPFFNRSLLLGPGVAELLRGSSRWPANLRPQIAAPGSVEQRGFEAWLEQPDCRRAIAALEQDRALDVVVIADDPRAAIERARVLAAAAGRPAALLELDPKQALEGWPSVAAQITAQTIGRALVPIVAVRAGDERQRGLPSLAALPGPAIFCATREQLQLGGRRAAIVVDCGRLGVAGIRTAWAHALPGLADHAAELAARFPIEPGLIHEIAADLRAQVEIDGRESSPADLFERIRLRARSSLRPGIRLRRPRATWDSLVLPAERTEQLRDALARVRQQARVLDDWGFLANRPGARGVRLLLCGPPGTGKTLSAEVLARELDTDLLIVDLSQLVSKWIGETEKNLAEVFATAERSRAVLLFDEADALFGKRTEISDAHDRYANLETAYLLTRLEQYEGLAVLATNLRRNIDAAFMRRLEFVIDYELPSRAERLQLWRVHLPGGAPLSADVALRELADFYPLAGGLIRNAAVAAAFLAAETDGPITRAHLLRAIRREYEKTGAAFPGTPPNRSRS